MTVGIQGSPRRYDKKFLFAVEISGLEVAWFTSMSQLSGEVGVVEQHEGGIANVADQSPGKLKYKTVTLSVGSTDNTELYDWWQQVIDAANNSGEVDEDYKKTVYLIVKDRNQREKRRYKLFKAWPKMHVAGEWDAKVEENVIESVELVYLRYTRKEAA